MPPRKKLAYPSDATRERAERDPALRRAIERGRAESLGKAGRPSGRASPAGAGAPAAPRQWQEGAQALNVVSARRHTSTIAVSGPALRSRKHRKRLARAYSRYVAVRAAGRAAKGRKT